MECDLIRFFHTFHPLVLQCFDMTSSYELFSSVSFWMLVLKINLDCFFSKRGFKLFLRLFLLLCLNFQNTENKIVYFSFFYFYLFIYLFIFFFYRDTPTAAGPNSYGKGRLGFSDRQKIFEREIKKKADNPNN